MKAVFSYYNININIMSHVCTEFSIYTAVLKEEEDECLHVPLSSRVL